LGGILLGWQALDRLGFGLSQLADAWIAWRRVRELMGAADTAAQASAPPSFSPRRAKRRSRAPSERPVFETVRMSFQHASSSRPLLDSVSCTIRSGERLLLEGASGAGKSTLAALIAGLRAPTSGALLAGGIDRQTLGPSGWRQRVAMAAQFHENHVITESFAFNLLLGRCWPPSAEDIDLAEAVCRELGLGELLERMPGGMFQMVGETAWQLSHGERSRLFLARALLQEPDLCVLDESLAALDPENLSLVIACLEKRAHSVLAIAHP
jgi:ATP-binding cassette subfamily B protein